MRTTDTAKWHTLFLRPNFERKMAKELGKLGFEVFLPVKKEEKHWSDRKKVLERPLFPSYLFINLPDQSTFRRALSIINIKSFVRFGSDFALLKSFEIDQIKILEQSNCVTNIEILNHSLKNGELLEITNGPLKGLKCFFDDQKGGQEIVVHIESLRQNIKVTLPKNSVCLGTSQLAHA